MVFIIVSEETHFLLSKYKVLNRCKSFDELLKKLLSKNSDLVKKGVLED